MNQIDIKDTYYIIKYYLKLMMLLNSSKNPKKCIMVSTKIFNSTTVFQFQQNRNE